MRLPPWLRLGCCLWLKTNHPWLGLASELDTDTVQKSVRAVLNSGAHQNLSASLQRNSGALDLFVFVKQIHQQLDVGLLNDTVTLAKVINTFSSKQRCQPGPNQARLSEAVWSAGVAYVNIPPLSYCLGENIYILVSLHIPLYSLRDIISFLVRVALSSLSSPRR